MLHPARSTATAVLMMAVACVSRAAAQHHPAAHGTTDAQDIPAAHAMHELHLGGGWRALGMAQVFPMLTAGFGAGANDAVTQTGLYASQPVVMFNIESPTSRLTLRTTLNFEGITQPGGELTFGGWGEGFIDRRHPHTLLHEAVLSVNFPDIAAGGLSLSAGKGFAPYGTDDPMSRPVVKFPTNHHLSQILERFFVSAAWRSGGWSVEAGVFGGNEPTGPYDFSNIESFPNSWSARVVRRFGGAALPWEASASFGHVVEEHGGHEATTRLVNAYVRHEGATRLGTLYALVEWSRSFPADHPDDGFFSLLGEAQLARGRHRPYARVEYATRPEYEREGGPGDAGFHRYDHDDHVIGATRWVITTLGYGYDATLLPISARPFVEVQHNNAATERGPVAARELFGTSSFFSLTAGVRVFLGGGPMRMGAYGVLDPVTAHAATHVAPEAGHTDRGHDHH